MRLAEPNLDMFMYAIAKINKLMGDEDTCSNLLDEAKEDTPIIDQLLTEMQRLYEHKEGPQQAKGVDMAERDLTVLLAIREIERAKQ